MTVLLLNDFLFIVAMKAGKMQGLFFSVFT